MALIAIVAVDLNNGIGNKGQLLFHIKEDMEWFKNNTIGKVVVMGRKTFESLPNQKPLKNRLNIVLSSNGNFKGCINISNIQDIIDIAQVTDVYVIGGEQLYKQLLPYYDEILLTKVYALKEADAFFPYIDSNQLKIVDESDIIKTKQYSIKFIKYKRVECYNTNGQFIKTYASISAAAKELKISTTAIYNNLNGLQKTCKNMIFKKIKIDQKEEKDED